jgi:pimeloyl-ACP methyl ester carboxylesterase
MIHRGTITRFVFIGCAAWFLCSCTYLKYAGVQAEYARIQAAEPGQINVKHMIDRDSYFIYGLSTDPTGGLVGIPKAIAAFSSKYQENELVDTMFFGVSGSHYGLTVPEGAYEVLVFADVDGDQVFESTEAVGRRSVELNTSSAPEKVLGQVDIQLGEVSSVEWDVAIDAPDVSGRLESVYFPSGTIRSLDDPIFDRSFSTLGMYDPASFLEQVSTMFFALEEDLAYKIPVIFVHGIDGSAREFETLVGQLDRNRYKPWFYHYPSGGDLDQMAEMFYQIFLSGRLYRAGGMPVIVVAHSMGGLVVREALNRYKGNSNENQVHLFASMATPFGGHAAAASGERHGLIVLPSWRDLNPENSFIRDLYRKPLPDFTHHELIYAYRDPGTIKIGENSDGVVALTSQLHPPAQRQASGQFGFDNTHTDILESKEVASHIMTGMNDVPSIFPPLHVEYLRRGGYDVPLDDHYSPVSKYVIRTYGKYLVAVAREEIPSLNPEQDEFIALMKGERSPRNDDEKEWLRFVSEYPELVKN